MDKVKQGTRIRFLRELSSCADEESPGNLYARKGDLGTIALQASLKEPNGTWEGFWVFWSHHRTAAFGCEAKDFEILPELPLEIIHFKTRFSWPLCSDIHESKGLVSNMLALCTCKDCLNKYKQQDGISPNLKSRIEERIASIDIMVQLELPLEFK